MSPNEILRHSKRELFIPPSADPLSESISQDNGSVCLLEEVIKQSRERACGVEPILSDAGNAKPFPFFLSCCFSW